MKTQIFKFQTFLLVIKEIFKHQDAEMIEVKKKAGIVILKSEKE